MKGRKRFLLVDTLELVFGICALPGDCSEATGAKALFTRVQAGCAEQGELDQLARL